MAVVHAPKIDFVGRGVIEADGSTQDDLLRARLDAFGTLGVSDPRISEVILHLSGGGTLDAATPSATGYLDTADLTGTSALTAEPPASDFRADLTGDLLFESEPTRAHLSGAGDVQAVATGGQGVVFVSRHLSGSGDVTATSQPLEHSVSADLSASAHLGVVGEGSEYAEVDLTAESTLSASAEVIIGYQSRVTQLTGEGGLVGVLRDSIPARAEFIANGVFSETRLAVVPIADQTMQEGNPATPIPVRTKNAVDPATLTATGLPDGLTLVDNGDGTGQITGTPTYDTSVGTHAVTVTIADAYLRQSSIVFSIEVQSVWRMATLETSILTPKTTAELSLGTMALEALVMLVPEVDMVAFFGMTEYANTNHRLHVGLAEHINTNHHLHMGMGEKIVLDMTPSYATTTTKSADGYATTTTQSADEVGYATTETT